jgi:energy-coupling factor transport system substrate-specific component
MTAPAGASDRPALRLAFAPAATLVVASLAGLAMFLWPLLLQPPEGTAHVTDAPFLFILVLPVLAAVVLGELNRHGMDAKALAMLGVLTAVGAALRPLSAGVGGLELIFFLLVLGGRVYGPAFGFVLGSTTLFASALITGGMGPWLPFQMLASSWVGLGAGLLPRRPRGRLELTMLAAYGALAALAYGFLLNMWFWPFATGSGTDISFVPGGAVLENLQRFLLYCLATSTWGWDSGRAITTVIAIIVVGPAVLGTLRRASRKAAFDRPVEFESAEPMPEAQAR